MPGMTFWTPLLLVAWPSAAFLRPLSKLVLQLCSLSLTNHFKNKSLIFSSKYKFSPLRLMLRWDQWHDKQVPISLRIEFKFLSLS